MARPFRISMNLENTTFKATADINKYDQDTQKKIMQVIADGTKDVYETAKNKAPIITGELREGIEMDVVGAHGTVCSTSHVSHLVEFGTGPRIASPLRAKAMVINGNFVKGHVISVMPKKPFMRPAAEAGKPKIDDAMKEALK